MSFSFFGAISLTAIQYLYTDSKYLYFQEQIVDMWILLQVLSVTSLVLKDLKVLKNRSCRQCLLLASHISHRMTSRQSVRAVAISSGCVSALRQYTNNLRSCGHNFFFSPPSKAVCKAKKKTTWSTEHVAITHSMFIWKRQPPWSATWLCLQNSECSWSTGHIYNSTRLHECDNLAHPHSDLSAPSLIKMSARKCPSLRFLPLMLNQHLSPQPSALWYKRSRGLREINQLLQRYEKHRVRSIQPGIKHLRSNNKSTRGLPRPPECCNTFR